MAEQIFPAAHGGPILEQTNMRRKEEQQDHTVTVAPHPLLPLHAHGFAEGTKCKLR